MELKIGTPRIRREQDRVFLCADVTIEGTTAEAWFSVEPQYGQYLTEDRVDAFVLGFLTTAMRTGADIVCEAPMTRRLKYQLQHYLIPTMADNMEIYHPITLHGAVTDQPLPCENAVGTGWTGGVDSMYTLTKHIALDNPTHRLTHLVIANNGALESDHNTELLAFMVDKARRGIARELGLSVIGIDSNLQLLQQEAYLAVAAFRLPAVVLAVQKLFGVFLNSGAYEFPRFSFVQENSAYYELLPLDCFETDCTTFYSACGAVPRIQKLKELSEVPLAHKYLHPCIYISRDNCGKCGKCVRTITALYALGTLDRFRESFDVDMFYRDKDEYLVNVLSNKESQHYGEVVYTLEQRGIEIPDEVRRRARIRRAATIVAQRKLKPKEE